MADSLEDYASALEHRRLVNVCFLLSRPPYDLDLIGRFRSYTVRVSALGDVLTDKSALLQLPPQQFLCVFVSAQSYPLTGTLNRRFMT